MASVTMDIAELDQLKLKLKEQEEKINLFEAKEEINKKTVYVETRIFDVSFDTENFYKDVENYFNSLNYIQGKNDIMSVFYDFLKRNTRNYLSMNQSNSRTIKSYVGFDETKKELESEITNKFESKIKSLEEDKEDLNKRIMNISKSMHQLAREKSLKAMEEYSDKIIELEKHNNQLSIENQKLNSSVYHQDLAKAKESLEELCKSLEFYRTKSDQNAIDRDKLKDKIIDLHDQIKIFNKKNLFSRMLFKFNYSEQLL